MTPSSVVNVELISCRIGCGLDPVDAAVLNASDNYPPGADPPICAGVCPTKCPSDLVRWG
jgi:hypothetical protein